MFHTYKGIKMVKLEKQNYNENHNKFKEIKQKLENKINKNLEVSNVGST